MSNNIIDRITEVRTLPGTSSEDLKDLDLLEKRSIRLKCENTCNLFLEEIEEKYSFEGFSPW